MTVNIEKIYRVVCDDNYQRTTPETYWTKDKQECESYIQNCYYKHCVCVYHGLQIAWLWFEMDIINVRKE